MDARQVDAIRPTQLRGNRRWRFSWCRLGRRPHCHAHLVTPNRTDRLCVAYFIRGEMSCQNGNRVVLNAIRWLLDVESYGSD
jgi:hypothetical protein